MESAISIVKELRGAQYIFPHNESKIKEVITDLKTRNQDLLEILKDYEIVKNDPQMHPKVIYETNIIQREKRCVMTYLFF